MLSRTLAAMGVVVWSFLVLSTAMDLVSSPGSWLKAIGVGVVAPIVLMTQINRVISLYEDRKQTVPGFGVEQWPRREHNDAG